MIRAFLMGMLAAAVVALAFAMLANVVTSPSSFRA
jgi:hypothetical protein